MLPLVRVSIIIASITLFCLAGCGQPSGDADSDSAKATGRSDATWTIVWSQITKGMNAVEVLTLLDEPVSVKVSKVNTTWYYSSGGADGPYVALSTRSATVEHWRPPERR